MTESHLQRPTLVLDPQERVAEILFGLIMALSFTGAIQVTMAGSEEVRPILAAALGCNIAWGLVDGVMFVVQRLVDRGRTVALSRGFLASTTEAEQRRLLATGIPAEVVDALSTEGLDRVRQSLQQRLPAHVRITGADLRGALATFLLVVIATFPVVLPYLLFTDLATAKRVSNVVSIAMLFAAGFALGRYSGGRPVALGLGMVGIGISLVGITMALGG